MSEKLVAEFDREMPPTRKLLGRVPGDKGEWKPHPKSFALGHLAQLVSDMPGWLTRVVRQMINHFSHHRGQLTVYLRPLEIPVASIYGPTADEGWAVEGACSTT